jgi:hypothetical protein
MNTWKHSFKSTPPTINHEYSKQGDVHHQMILSVKEQ